MYFYWYKHIAFYVFFIGNVVVLKVYIFLLQVAQFFEEIGLVCVSACQ